MQFKKILVNALPRQANDPATAVAASLAMRFSAKLTLFDVSHDFSWSAQYLVGGWEETIEGITENKKSLLEEQAEALRARGIDADCFLAGGRLSAATVRRVVDGNYDLVVRVAQGDRPNRSGFLGSTDFRLMRKCPCPVLILRPDATPGFERVAASLDILDDHEIQRELDQRVLSAAIAFCDGELHLVYALRPIEEALRIDATDKDMITPDKLKQWETELRQAATIKLETARAATQRAGECHLLAGAPDEAVPDFVKTEGIDLLVMGSLGRSGLDGFLIGNTAEQVLNRVQCSVLALKPENFGSSGS